MCDVIKIGIEGRNPVFKNFQIENEFGYFNLDGIELVGFFKLVSDVAADMLINPEGGRVVMDLNGVGDVDVTTHGSKMMIRHKEKWIYQGDFTEMAKVMLYSVPLALVPRQDIASIIDAQWKIIKEAELKFNEA